MHGGVKGIDEADMEINERVKINQWCCVKCNVFIHIWPSSPLQIWLPCFNYLVYLADCLANVDTILQNSEQLSISYFRQFSYFAFQYRIVYVIDYLMMFPQLYML
jgi:hypothetical protein